MSLDIDVASVPNIEASASSPNFRTRIPELDGLRGLAILFVLIFHFGCDANSAADHRWLFHLIDVGSLFWSGVDLFFVLSGFLIGGILLDVRNSPNYFRTFYTRRAFRIIPIYALVVGAFYLLMASGFPARTGSDWLFGRTVPWYAYLTFTQNIGFATGTPSLALWLSATWSLAVEEQFYLILPAVIWLASDRLLPYLLGGAILSAPLLRLLLNLNYAHGKVASLTLMPCRADALLLGVAVAMLVRRRSLWESLKTQRVRLVSGWIVLLAGLPLFILFGAANPLESFWMSTVGLSWIALFYAGLLLLALIYSDSWYGRILRISWLMGLGTISYSVYLFHWPVLGLTFMLLRHKRPWAETSGERGLLLLALAVTIVTASLSWTFFEKRLLKLGHDAKY